MLVLVAVVAIALAGLWWFQAYRTAQAQDIVGENITRPTPPEIAQAEELLDQTTLLNPHTTADFRRAVGLLGIGQTERATRILLDLVDAEPTNAEAWAVLTSAARMSGDKALERRARAAVAELNPYEQRDRGN